MATAETPQGVAEANQSAPTTMKKYDWAIPVRDFFRTAKKHGLEPIAVNNGDGWVSTSTLALDAATDEHYNNWEGKPCPTTTTEQ